MDRNQLSKAFAGYFEYSVAHNAEARAESYRLRYDVYCTEFGYEDPSDHPNHQERDAFDEGALICTLRHTHTNRLAGCFRIILPRITDSAPRVLQLEEDCAETLYAHDQKTHNRDPRRLSRLSICEVSRLAIHSDFRRRLGEHQTRLGALEWLDLSDQERDAHLRTFPLLGSSLFSAVAYTCSQLGRDHIYAVMEPRLARLLTREGIRFEQIGAVMDYHGEERAVYYNSLEKFVVETIASPLLRPLYQMAQDQLAPGLGAWLKQLPNTPSPHSGGGSQSTKDP